MCHIFFTHFSVNEHLACFHVLRKKKKKKRAKGTRLPDLRLYFIATVIKIVWYWCKNRNVNQWNKIGRPEINSQNHGQSLTKEARIYNRENTVSSISDAGKTGQLQVKSEIRTLPNSTHTHTHTHTHSKWFKK